jgi:hypothetical protein
MNVLCENVNGHDVPCSITGGLRTYIHMSVSVYSVVAMMLVEPCFVNLLIYTYICAYIYIYIITYIRTYTFIYIYVP